jgi:hypothetical protein
MTNHRAICALMSAAALAAAPATRPAVPAHLRDAEALVADVRPGDNDYVFGGEKVRWATAGGSQAECQADCSGLLTAVVRHAYGWSLERVKAVTGRTRPRAVEWHDAIVANRPPLHAIPQLADVRPGDLLVVRYPPDAQKATGHVMMADGVPVPHPPSEPIVPGTAQWDVVVIDSAKSGHGPADTREHADGSHDAGVGRGTLRVYTHANGSVAGYAWSDGADAKFQPQAEHHLVIGRIDPDVAVRSSVR